MAVIINNFEAVVDPAGTPEAGKSGKMAKSPVTSQAQLLRTLAIAAARQNRLRAS
jgi:hypothetical protein